MRDIRASVDALYRDGASEISRDPRTKCLKTRSARMTHHGFKITSNSQETKYLASILWRISPNFLWRWKKKVFLLRSSDSYLPGTVLKRRKSGGVIVYLGGLMCLMVFGMVVFSLHICLLYIWTGFWLKCLTVVLVVWCSSLCFVGTISASALRHNIMFSTCSDGLIFNANKTQLICFRSSKSCNFQPTINLLDLQLKSNISVMSWTIIWMMSLILLTLGAHAQRRLQ